MKLKRHIDRWRPSFGPGGRFHAFHSVFEGVESFLFTPSETSGATGVHVHDAFDSKRLMITVVVALMPCLLMGIYNTGYQNWLAAGATGFPFWPVFAYGLLAVVPRIAVTYLVGLGIEFIVAQWRREEIQEGFLVTGILIPMICPVETPLWMLAAATAFAVVFAKEVFGGTGYNIVNVALIARAFLFFAYPAHMSGDSVFVASHPILGLGHTLNFADGISGATPLGQIAGHAGGALTLTSVTGNPLTWWDAFIGLIPGSVGETSTLCIILGGALLLLTGIASWRIIAAAVAGALAVGTLAWMLPSAAYPASMLNPLEQFLYGGLSFAIVFMATDPVTAARTDAGKWIYGFLVGAIAVTIRTYNNGYPEGAMLAVLLMNCMAPLIDHLVVEAHARGRVRRALKLKGGRR